MKRRALAATTVAAILVGLSFSGTAGAAAPSKATVNVYRLPRVPPTGGAGPLAVDSLGNVWFDETYEVPPEEPGEPPRFRGQIVRMNREGEIVLAIQKRPTDLTIGPDGSAWFTGFYEISRLAPDGTLSVFPLPDGENDEGKFVFDDGPLLVGADGNVWFSGARGLRKEDGSAVGDEPIIGRLTPSGELTEFDLPRDGGHPIRMAAGPDGNVWFTEPSSNRVARITPTGDIQGFPLSPTAQPAGIAAGPDGAVWFMERREKDSAIARITTSGALTEFPLQPSAEEVAEEVGGLFGAGSVAAGSDGRIWFAHQAGSIGRITPSGRVSSVPIPTRSPEDIAVGPEGSVWYTSAAEPPCLPGDTVCGDGGYYQSGVIGRVDLAPLSVEIAGAKPSSRARRVKVGLTCIDGSATSICRGVLRLRVRGETIAKRRFRLGADRSQTISLRLGEAARTRLRSRGRLRVRAIATVAGGRTEARALRLQMARAPGRRLRG
jgi:virginiamycin B lyase